MVFIVVLYECVNECVSVVCVAVFGSAGAGDKLLCVLNVDLQGLSISVIFKSYNPTSCAHLHHSEQWA